MPTDMEGRTEPASARKLRRARSRGDVPRSPLSVAWVALVAAGAAVALTMTDGIEVWSQFATEMFRLNPLSGAPAAWSVLGDRAGALTLSLLTPILVPIMGVTLLSTLLVAGGPTWSLSGGPRARGRPSCTGGLSALAGVVLALLFGWVTLGAMRGLWGRTELNAAEVLEAMRRIGIHAGARTSLVALVGAAALAFLARYRWLRAQRMSRREVEDEQRATEGQPLSRQRRAQARARLRALPTLRQAVRETRLAVEGPNSLSLIAWPGPKAAPRITLHARTPTERAEVRALLAERQVSIVYDRYLSLQLLETLSGRVVPVGLRMRLAQHFVEVVADG